MLRLSGRSLQDVTSTDAGSQVRGVCTLEPRTEAALLSPFESGTGLGLRLTADAATAGQRLCLTLSSHAAVLTTSRPGATLSNFAAARGASQHLPGQDHPHT